MSEDTAGGGREQRRDERLGLAEQVAIQFSDLTLVGSGENISSQGVYFTVDATIPVRVRIGDGQQEVEGHLIRASTIEDGRVGIAVRFAEPDPAAGSSA